MEISICMATRNQAALLRRTLDSIIIQNYQGEIIITDDGSDDDTRDVVMNYPSIKYIYLKNSEYHNAVTAKNSSLMAATGDIIIQQSSDVLHASPNLIEELIYDFKPGEFRIATVYDWNASTGNNGFCHTGIENKRPLFFLGACWRSDVCKIGGYDPDFAHVCWYDDNWHGDCLIRGAKLNWSIAPQIGLHQTHSRLNYDTQPATEIYNKKIRQAEIGEIPWCSSAGPWPFIQGVSAECALRRV